MSHQDPCLNLGPQSEVFFLWWRVDLPGFFITVEKSKGSPPFEEIILSHVSSMTQAAKREGVGDTNGSAKETGTQRTGRSDALTWQHWTLLKVHRYQQWLLGGKGTQSCSGAPPLSLEDPKGQASPESGGLSRTVEKFSHNQTNKQSCTGQ